MKYKETKETLMEAYPSLFLYEADVLHHLFFVIGNGYEWENGELVGRNMKKEDLIKEARESNRRFLLDSFNWAKNNDSEPSFFENYYKKELALLDDPDYVKKKRRRELKRRKLWIEESHAFRCPDGRIGRQIYPLCEYSCIMTLPSDIKPDWLKAARKALQLIPSGYLSVSRTDKKWLLKAEKHIQKIMGKKR